MIRYFHYNFIRLMEISVKKQEVTVIDNSDSDAPFVNDDALICIFFDLSLCSIDCVYCLLALVCADVR